MLYAIKGCRIPAALFFGSNHVPKDICVPFIDLGSIICKFYFCNPENEAGRQYHKAGTQNRNTKPNTRNSKQ